jgi:hypothetical protein
VRGHERALLPRNARPALAHGAVERLDLGAVGRGMVPVRLRVRPIRFGEGSLDLPDRADRVARVMPPVRVDLVIVMAAADRLDRVDQRDTGAWPAACSSASPSQSSTSPPERTTRSAPEIASTSRGLSS